MIIESVRVQNYRSILNETLHCERLTALVGANGTGKSSFLRALELFYSPVPKVDPGDFYNGDTHAEIAVAVTFRDLSPEANELFSQYLQADRLTVELVFTWENGKVLSKYHGATLQNPAFRSVRDALNIKDRGKTAKDAYEALRVVPDYRSLEPWSTVGVVEGNLRHWETAHPAECVRQRDDGQFFGFREVGQGYLGRFTKLLFIPAVRDAAEDSSESRGSVLTALMDLVVRSVLANKDAVIRLRDETRKQYEEIMDPAKLTELTTLADQMTNTLQTFVRNARIELTWQPLSEPNIPMPQADIRLVEDEYSCSVVRTGHGLQRAFILTLLQHLALAQTATATNTKDSGPCPKLPNLVLVVEEPELYQHPSRQRHLAGIFQQLASGKTPGVAENTQIIYGTHSPLFVGIDRIDQLRLLRKTSNDGRPKFTKVISTSLDRVAEIIWQIDGERGDMYTGPTLLPRLQAIMTPWMNEGFFADVVVLVEGEDDRAAILGAAKALGHEMEGEGISVIPCGGKASMDRPYVVFQQLGIPVYAVWDGDYGMGETQGVCEKCQRPLDKKADPRENRRLLRMVGYDEIDWPELVEDAFACFKTDLETTLQEDIGQQVFETCLAECQASLGIAKRRHAIKNPRVIEAVLLRAQEQGCNSSTLQTIVERILAFREAARSQYRVELRQTSVVLSNTSPLSVAMGNHTGELIPR